MVPQRKFTLVHPPRNRDLGGHRNNLVKAFFTNAFPGQGPSVRPCYNARRHLVGPVSALLSEPSKVFHRESGRVYRCGRTIGHLTVRECTVTGVPIFLFAFLVSSCEMDGKAERRWFGTSPCDNERTIALRTNALRAYEGKSSELIPPGPRSRIGIIQLNWVSSAYCPNVTYLLFGGRKALSDELET